MCESRARKVLDGLGDPILGEWTEWSGVAFHLRRRLNAAEQDRVGAVRDIRRTQEAVQRATALGDLISYAPPEVLADEIGVL